MILNRSFSVQTTKANSQRFHFKVDNWTFYFPSKLSKSFSVCCEKSTQTVTTENHTNLDSQPKDTSNIENVRKMHSLFRTVKNTYWRFWWSV